MEPSKGTRARDDYGDGLGAAAPSPPQQRGGGSCDEKPSPMPPRGALRWRRLRGWQHAAQPRRASPSPAGTKRSHLQGDLREDASRADGTAEPPAAAQGGPRAALVSAPRSVSLHHSAELVLPVREQPRGCTNTNHTGTAAMDQNVHHTLFPSPNSEAPHAARTQPPRELAFGSFFYSLGHNTRIPPQLSIMGPHGTTVFSSFQTQGRRRRAALPGHPRAPTAAAKNWDGSSLSPSHKRPGSSFRSGEDRPSPPFAQPSRTETPLEHRQQNRSGH